MAKLNPCLYASREYCMCGSRMDEHSGWEGHSAMSEYDYCAELGEIDPEDEGDNDGRASNSGLESNGE